MIMMIKKNSFSIFVHADASFRNILSANILSLQEKGKLTALKNRWWKEKRGGGACQVSVAFLFFALPKLDLNVFSSPRQDN